MSNINYTVIGQKDNSKVTVVTHKLNNRGVFDSCDTLGIGVDVCNELELICTNYKGSNSDLIFGYNRFSGRDRGVLFLGKWNK